MYFFLCLPVEIYLDFYASLKNDFAENDKKVTVYSKIARSLFKATTPAGLLEPGGR